MVTLTRLTQPGPDGARMVDVPFGTTGAKYVVSARTRIGYDAKRHGDSILVKYGTPDQKRQWLMPLIEGTMESGFSMTEPHNAGSDPRSLDTSAVRDGDEWVINGHKWFSIHLVERSGRFERRYARIPIDGRRPPRSATSWC